MADEPVDNLGTAPMRFRTGRPIAALATAIAILLTLASCTRHQTPIYVAINPWPGYAFFFLAEERGYFRDAGLDVRLVELLSLGDVRRAFEERHVQVMASTIVEPVLVSALPNLNPRVVHVCDKSNGCDMLLAQPEFHSIANLRGHRIGYESLSADIVGVVAALKYGNIALKDVTLVPMPQAEMAEAFRTKQVDAIQCYPPLSTRLLAEKSCVCVFDSSGGRTTVIDCITTTRDFAEANFAALQSLIVAYQRAVQDYAEHPDEAIAIMSQRVGLEPGEFRAMLKGVLIHDHSNPDHSLASTFDIKQSIALAVDSIQAGSENAGTINAAEISNSILEFYSHSLHDSDPASRLGQ